MPISVVAPIFCIGGKPNQIRRNHSIYSLERPQEQLGKWNCVITVKCLLWPIELISSMCSIAIVVWHVIVLAELIVLTELIVLCVLVELIVLSVLIELIILHIWHRRWQRCWQKPQLHNSAILVIIRIS